MRYFGHCKSPLLSAHFFHSSQKINIKAKASKQLNLKFKAEDCKQDNGHASCVLKYIFRRMRMFSRSNIESWNDYESRKAARSTKIDFSKSLDIEFLIL